MKSEKKFRVVIINPRGYLSCGLLWLEWVGSALMSFTDSPPPRPPAPPVNPELTQKKIIRFSSLTLRQISIISLKLTSSI